MISGISGSSGFYTSGIASKLLKRLDTNSDGGIDVSELQAVAAGSDIDSSELITSLDTDANGTVDTAELESVLRKLTGEGHHGPRPPKAENGAKPPDPSEMFATADTNGDGVVDKDEFAAMAPSDADSAMTDEIFASIDTDGNGSIDEAENEAAMQRMGPPPEAGGAGNNPISGAGSQGNDMLVKLLEALQNSDGAEGADDNDKTLQAIAQLVDDLQNGTTYGRLGDLAMSTSGARNLFSASA